MISRRREQAFMAGAGAMPRALKLAQMLNLRISSGAQLKLDGPQLMWGTASYSIDGIERKNASLLRRMAGGMWRFFVKNMPFFLLTWLATAILFAAPLFAQGVPNIMPEAAETPEDVTSTIELMLLLTVLTIAPSILIMTTAFTRIVVVFGFLRMALSTQQVPPTQVLTGLALILTFMVMRPTFTNIKDHALVPYLDAKITQSEAFDRSLRELRKFMFAQVAQKDLIEFGYMSGDEPGEWAGEEDVDTLVLVPAFVTSELKRGFYMGFMLYLPFLVIDLIVSTVLISMGMLVLPPVLISLPFKLLLFVLVDGWQLVVRSLFNSFNAVEIIR